MTAILRSLRTWRSRLRAALVRLLGARATARRERDLDEELASHLALHIEDNLRAGMTPEAARRQALIKLGGIEPVKERVRERRGVPALEHLLLDLRFGARMLRKSPTFTAVAVLTLALGIGANSALFSVVNAVLLRPLPYPQAERLVLVFATNAERGLREDVASYPEFEDWRAAGKSFECMAAFTTRGMTLAGADGAEAAAAIQATPGFFELLRVRPLLGRTFRPDEGEAGRAGVALLSHGAWQRRFAGRRDVLGQTVRANQGTYTIIGIMPPGFRVNPGAAEQLYVPLVKDPNRGHGFLLVLGRLRADARMAAAQAEMDLITRRLARQYPKTDGGIGARVVPLLDAVVGNSRTALLIFCGVVAAVLLIACTNVASLMSARAAARQQELSVRMALGAGRRRLTQQLLAECALLGLVAGAAGLLLAGWGARLLITLLAKNFPIPRLENAHTDGWVLGFTLVLSLATGLLCGSALALPAPSGGLKEGLGEATRTVSAGRRGRRARGVLVVAETALALWLLAGAGLLLKSLLTLRGAAVGFSSGNLVTVDLKLPEQLNAGERRRFFGRLLARVGAVSGVRAAALVADLPLGGGSDTQSFHVVGRPDPAPGRPFRARFNIVSAGYFKTMGIPVRAGREFAAEDSAGSPGAIVVNESAARVFWPAAAPVGRQIILPGDNQKSSTLTVVGVAGDVRQQALGGKPQPEIFLDYAQPGPAWGLLVLVVRTTGDAARLTGTIAGVARSVDRDVAVLQARAMDDVLAGSLAQPRVYTLLLGVFAALALLLAAVGLYGVVSYTARQRSHEMGIRMALGARRGDVVRLVLRQGLGLSLAGTAIGLAGALAMARLLAHLLPGLRPGEPLTLSAVSALLLGVALLASYLPARRGSRVDPIVTLRSEV